MKMLVYRNNDFWSSIHGEIIEMIKRINPDAGDCIAHVFPASTSVEEIKVWVESNKDSITLALESGMMGSLFTDSTVEGVIASCGIKGYFRNLTKDIMGKAFETALEGKDPSAVYRELFKRFVSAARISRVLIVSEYLADYNPLSLPAFVLQEGQEKEEIEKVYAEAFVSLIPNGTTCKVVSIRDLANGFKVNEDDLFVYHHHAMQRIPGDSRQLGIGDKLRERALSVTTYLSGFIPQISNFVEVSDLVQEDIMRIARSIVASKGAKKS